MLAEYQSYIFSENFVIYKIGSSSAKINIFSRPESRLLGYSELINVNTLIQRRGGGI